MNSSLAFAQATTTVSRADRNLPLSTAGDEILTRTSNTDLWPTPTYASQLLQPNFLPVVRLYVGYRSKAHHGFASTCSGVVIGPKLILTARHCFQPEFDDSLTVGERFDEFAAIAVTDQLPTIPDTATSAIFSVHQKHVFHVMGFARTGSTPLASLDSATNDAVVVRVDRDIAKETGVAKIWTGDLRQLPLSTKLSFAGFPTENGANARGAVATKYFSGELCDIAAIENNVIFSDCTPAGGLSGGPVFISKNGHYEIIGVLSRAINADPLNGVNFTGLTWLKEKSRKGIL